MCQNKKEEKENDVDEFLHDRKRFSSLSTSKSWMNGDESVGHCLA